MAGMGELFDDVRFALRLRFRLPGRCWRSSATPGIGAQAAVLSWIGGVRLEAMRVVYDVGPLRGRRRSGKMFFGHYGRR